jgi:anaerobic ribonucleoside-triphosphate reductase activating protein
LQDVELSSIYVNADEKQIKLRLSGTIKESIVDGPGIRFVVFVQGCPHRCEGCHNPETHDPLGGYEESLGNLKFAIKQNPILKGVTFSGGEPFLQPKPLVELAKFAHFIGLDVVTYTGYTVEEILTMIQSKPYWKALLEETDTLIDGPFILKEKSLILKFRGSKNQRIIDPRNSIKQNKAVEKEF